MPRSLSGFVLAPKRSDLVRRCARRDEPAAVLGSVAAALSSVAFVRSAVVSKTSHQHLGGSVGLSAPLALRHPSGSTVSRIPTTVQEHGTSSVQRTGVRVWLRGGHGFWLFKRGVGSLLGNRCALARRFSALRVLGRSEGVE